MKTHSLPEIFTYQPKIVANSDPHPTQRSFKTSKDEHHIEPSGLETGSCRHNIRVGRFIDRNCADLHVNSVAENLTWSLTAHMSAADLIELAELLIDAAYDIQNNPAKEVGGAQ